MALERLSSRAVIGEFYRRLNADPGMGWISAITNYFTSDQDIETYAWLGQVPAMREWIGGRQARGFSENGIDIRNKHFEATIKILVKDLRRDKSGQAMVRIGELAERTNSHWASLITALIVGGAATPCYDSQYFFDTDHAEGDSGQQSNKIDVDLSDLPAATHGVVTKPSVEEMQLAIVAGIQQMLKFKDDQGEPFNENAREFLVMTPVSLMQPAANAVSLRGDARQFASQTGFDALKEIGVSIRSVANPRLDAASWTDKFVVCRADGSAKAFIRQEETEVELKAVAEGSELEFKEDCHEYGVDTWRNVGYGMWQDAVQVTMVA